jgi:serine protease Do
VTDEIADTLNIHPTRGVLVAGVDERGPAKAGGIEAGDVIVKFDGKDIKESHDLPRIVADTPVDKVVEVVVLRKGQEMTKSIKVGRLEDNDKLAAATPNKKDAPPEEKTVVQKALGLDLADMSADLRKRYKIKDTVNGVVITGVDSASPAADKRLSAGDVIVEVAQEEVKTAADLQARVEKLKKEGRKNVLVLVSSADGELRFIALNLD